jgi:hypothetical protein
MNPVSRWYIIKSYIVGSAYLLNPFLLYLYGVEFFFSFGHFTDGRTLRASDQLVVRALPKHRITQTQNKHIHIPNIHALCGIRTNDPGLRASEDSTCLRPLGYRVQLVGSNGFKITLNYITPHPINNMNKSCSLKLWGDMSMLAAKCFVR